MKTAAPDVTFDEHWRAHGELRNQHGSTLSGVSVEIASARTSDQPITFTATVEPANAAGLDRFIAGSPLELHFAGVDDWQLPFEATLWWKEQEGRRLRGDVRQFELGVADLPEGPLSYEWFDVSLAPTGVVQSEIWIPTHYWTGEIKVRDEASRRDPQRFATGLGSWALSQHFHTKEIRVDGQRADARVPVPTAVLDLGSQPRHDLPVVFMAIEAELADMVAVLSFLSRRVVQIRDIAAHVAGSDWARTARRVYAPFWSPEPRQPLIATAELPSDAIARTTAAFQASPYERLLSFPQPMR